MSHNADSVAALPSVHGTFDAVTHAFLENVERATEPQNLPLAQARQALIDMQGNVAKPDVEILDRAIEAGPTNQISLRFIRPIEARADRLPAVMYFHGGGWVLGGKDTHDRLARELAVRARATVVLVDYDRAPEARYPVALEQGYAATKWISANGDSVRIDGSRIALAGDSSGGNLAAAIALLANDRGAPRIAYQLLLFPALDAEMSSSSYREFAEGPFLTRTQMEWFWDSYAPDWRARTKVTASPLLATTDDLRGLPPTLVITAANDVLRDEGEAYADKLLTAGVDATAVRYNNTFHSFLVFDALTGTPPARAALSQAGTALREALHDFGPRQQSFV